MLEGLGFLFVCLLIVAAVCGIAAVIGVLIDLDQRTKALKEREVRIDKGLQNLYRRMAGVEVFKSNTVGEWSGVVDRLDKLEKAQQGTAPSFTDLYSRDTQRKAAIDKLEARLSSLDVDCEMAMHARIDFAARVGNLEASIPGDFQRHEDRLNWLENSRLHERIGNLEKIVQDLRDTAVRAETRAMVENPQPIVPRSVDKD